MKKRMNPFTVCCLVFLAAFVLFTAWYIPSASSLRAKISETSQLLVTSRGRESKQQDEYDKAVADLPLVQAELKEKQPLAAQAEQTVADLKARRKELRAEKKALEEALNPESVPADASDAADQAASGEEENGNGK